MLADLEERELSAKMIQEIRNRERFLCFYFRVIYLDGHDKTRIFQDCLMYHCPRGLVPQGIDKDGWVPGSAAPKAYREYT